MQLICEAVPRPVGVGDRQPQLKMKAKRYGRSLFQRPGGGQTPPSTHQACAGGGSVKINIQSLLCGFIKLSVCFWFFFTSLTFGEFREKLLWSVSKLRYGQLYGHILQKNKQKINKQKKNQHHLMITKALVCSARRENRNCRFSGGRCLILFGNQIFFSCLFPFDKMRVLLWIGVN